MTLTLDAAALAARFEAVFGAGAGRRVAGAGPGQPDRRAHRLQRGLRPAVRHRPGGPGGGPAPRPDSSGPAAVHLRRPGADDGGRRSLAGRHGKGWTKYPLGVVWALQQRGMHVPGLGPAPGLRCPARRRAVLLPRDRMRRHLGPERAHRRRARPRRKWSWPPSTPKTTSSARPPASWTSPRRCAAPAGHAVFLDCRDQSVRLVPFDAEGAGLVLLVIDTKVSHSHADGGYASRRASCELGAEVLGVRALRDVGPSTTSRRPAACWTR